MNRVYTLYHIHRWKKELSECKYGHVDKKLIGLFFSKEESLNTLEKYKLLKGFSDEIEGFSIDEYIIDSIYNISISTLFDYEMVVLSSLKYLYILYHLQEFDDGHDDSKILGIFSTQIKAEEALSMIIKVSPSKVSKDQLLIVKDTAGSLDWKEGFFRSL